MTVIASLPGPAQLKVSVTCSMEKQVGRAWEPSQDCYAGVSQSSFLMCVLMQICVLLELQATLYLCTYVKVANVILFHLQNNRTPNPLTPSLPHSLIPSLPHSLIPALHHSITLYPTFTSKLPHSPTPSLPHHLLRTRRINEPVTCDKLTLITTNSSYEFHYDHSTNVGITLLFNEPLNS